MVTVTQECVICGSIYVDEQNLGDLDHPMTLPRADLIKELVPIPGNEVGKDKDIETLDLPDPAELKSNVTIAPAAIHPTVRSDVLYLLKRLKRVRRMRYSTPGLGCRTTRSKHVHQIFIS